MTVSTDALRAAIELSSTSYLLLQTREDRQADAVVLDANAPAARIFGVAGRTAITIGVPSLIIGRTLQDLIVLNDLRENEFTAATLLRPFLEMVPGEELRVRRLVAGRWMTIRGRQVSDRDLVIVVDDAVPEEWPLAKGGPLVLIRYRAAAPFLVTHCSPGLGSRSGISADGLVGQPFLNLVPESDHEEFTSALERFRDDTSQAQLELHYDICNTNGGRSRVHDFILPLGGASGVQGFVSHMWIER